MILYNMSTNSNYNKPANPHEIELNPWVIPLMRFDYRNDMLPTQPS